ncbi:hypothetical protein C8R42DRAFT_554160, partial [Lentinula raphanica]
NVKINRQTTVEELYHYTQNTKIEYPKTAADGKAIGHLFDMDNTQAWISPSRSFAYSLGEPRGLTRNVYTDVLVNSDGEKVPCNVLYSTCQGVKICPYLASSLKEQTHTSGSRDQCTFDLECEQRERTTSLDRDLLEKTLNYWAYLRDNGCGRELQQTTHYADHELDHYNVVHASPRKKKRGHQPKPTCEGRIVLRYTSNERPYLWNHFCDFSLANDIFHSEYLLALCTGDMDNVYHWEKAASDDGYGPLAPCSTVRNNTTVRVDCPIQHRTSEGSMLMTEMESLSCRSTFRVYEPLEEFRQMCPRILVVCSGEHTHPIPLSTKTPPNIRAEILDLLEFSMTRELADMTPRRFLRHPIVLSYIRQKVPFISQPQLSDVHPSLNNMDHLRAYITHVQDKVFPVGTGWEGLLRRKELQDRERPLGERYIRLMEELSLPNLHMLAGDDGDDEEEDSQFRIAICMFPQRSHDLLKARFIQSDISYKRVAGFKELELVGWDEQSKTTIVFCRAYMTRESAAAHLIFFRRLDDIVHKDTGHWLSFRHLHANSLQDRSGILHWAIDQGRGPAKGMALYLHELASRLPHSKKDLHEPDRYLHQLEPYDHLHRIARLCTAHINRNIAKSKVPEHIKVKMRSLMCIKHPDWERTIQEIEQSSKAGKDWILDKISSKFAFPGMCQEKSFIPLDIWKAGPATTDLVESAHWNSYLEGVGCSLTSGVEKAEHVDQLRL